MRFSVKPSKDTLYCFTPEVSLATFVIEVGFALYVFLKFKSTSFSRTCMALLICLGTFQLSEYMICTFHAEIWTKIGYIATLFLPAIGMHMTSLLTGKAFTLTWMSYGIAIGISMVALLYPDSYFVAKCQTHFVEMWNMPPFNYIHNIYYLVFILLACFMLVYAIRNRRKNRVVEDWLLIAYGVFLIPTFVLYFLRYIMDAAVPSVMCGFAIATAFIVTGIILPLFYRTNKLKLR